MKVVIIQPPIVQLNTPYPSGAYLQDFFKKLKSFSNLDSQLSFQSDIKSQSDICQTSQNAQNPLDLEAVKKLSPAAFELAKKAGYQIDSVEWKDLSIELFHRIFSKEGITQLFHNTKDKALKMALEAENQGDEITAYNLRRYVLTKDAWINWIDKIVALLVENKSGRETLHEFVRSAHVPRGSRMETYLANLNREVSVDDGYLLASLALADLADYITTVYDNNFALIRYAESICASDLSKEEILKTTNSPVLKDYLSPLVENLINTVSTSQQEPSFLFCVSVPFPGTFAAAMFICKQLKSTFGKNALITLGGGYVNTALRSVNQAELAAYIDCFSYDRGYSFYTELLANGLPAAAAYQTESVFGGEVVQGKANQTKTSSTSSNRQELVEIENFMTKNVAPDYEGIDFSKYPRLADDINPMHRIWSDGAWLKAYLAHGCYWHRCLFCDTKLDYVNCYKPVNIKNLYSSLLEQAKKSGVYGVHFVDEAAPPKMLEDFASLNKDKALTFWGNIRFEKAFSRDLADILAKGGLIGVSGGIEMACGEGLSNINKGIDIKTLVFSLAAFKEAGILTHAYMIYGYYNETPQMLIDSAETLRQLFKAGLLDSSFFHKFTLTKHSTLFAEWEAGKHPDLHPIFPKNNFTDYELHFKGEEKSEKYGAPLSLAVNAWMHKKSLDKPVEKWFNFPMPKPTVKKDFVEKALEEYEITKNQSYKEKMPPTLSSADFAWLPDSVEILPSGKNQFQLSWVFMGEIFYSDFSFSSIKEAKSTVESLQSLNLWNKTTTSVKIPEKLFKELRSKGLCKRL
ncbi:MAG: radical SAM protein [Spirochaetaceae bacterium]|nr:radical SAM protein [Spirochaetaceae bacterium]